MTPDPYRCDWCKTRYPVPSLARDCCSKGDPMPTTTCPVVVGTIACESGQRIVKGICLYHYNQAKAGRPAKVWKYTRSPGAAAVRDEGGNKQCLRCAQWLPVGNFTTNTRSADRLQVWCTKCTADYASVNRYGFSRGEVMDRVEAQGGCAICGCTDPNSSGYRNGWHVDHDHSCCPGPNTCGACVRSILCARCNKVLGAVNDDPDLLMHAAEYLTMARTREHRHLEETP